MGVALLGFEVFLWHGVLQVAEVQPFGLVSVCAEAFLWYVVLQVAQIQTLWLVDGVLFGYCVSGSHRFELCESTISLEAWVCRFKSCGLSGHFVKGFCLEHKLWVVFRVCLSCLWSLVCVVRDLLRVLLVCGNMLCIVVYLVLRPSNICRSSC